MRLYRNMNDATKQRISQRLKGRSMTDSHKQAISDSMKAYWKIIVYKPTAKNIEIKNNVINETNM